MRLRAWLLLPLLAGCAARPDPLAQVPPFARVPYEPFSRAAVVAIALREWRLFGMPVDDDPPGSRPPALPDQKPERFEGLWQRVGEYWWSALPSDQPEARWTGKHDATGRVFPADRDGDFAWSAAFVSYVMRIAGAGPGFPYAPAHHVYIDAAWQTAQGRASWLVSAAPPDAYAPRAGDLICVSRTAIPLSYADLPAARFAAHCDIVVAAQLGMLDVVGGNVDDAVTMKHVPVTPEGTLAPPGEAVLDTRYHWFVVLRLLV